MAIPNSYDILQAVIEATPDAIFVKDLDGRYVLVNEAAGRQLNPQPVDVNRLLDGLVRLLRRTLGATIRIGTALTADLGAALVDPAALEAAVLNIALNARDAMMPDGGTLTIRTTRIDVRESPATDDDLNPGAYAMLALDDTGCGMSSDVAARVFEPFFTTKGGCSCPLRRRIR